MRAIPSLMAVAAALLTAACDGAESERRLDDAPADSARAIADLGADPEHVLFGCLIGDSAVYSDVQPVAAGGVSGVRITLWHAGDGIDGSTVLAAGELGPSMPVAGVRLVGRDSIELDVLHDAAAPDTSFLVGRVSCDSLWGRQRTSRAAASRQASYGRLP
jgi:hypothetical protein